MLAKDVVPVVLSLPGVHDTLLRQVSGRAHAEEAGDGDVGECLIQVTRVRFKRIEAAAEFHVQTVEADAGFVDHARAEVVSPAFQDGLAQRGGVSYPAGCAVIAAVEVAATIED